MRLKGLLTLFFVVVNGKVKGNDSVVHMGNFAFFLTVICLARTNLI